MFQLISLELKRNGLHSYHSAVGISTVVMLGLLYLMVLIPKIDPAEADMAIFMGYSGLVNMTNVICMAIFTILSAVMYAKFIVEEYSGKRALLLFSYPVDRRNILKAKMNMVFLYTVTSMLLCGLVIFGIFFLSETVIHFSADTLHISIVLHCLLSLLCYSLLAGVWGSVALWFGFRKRSVQITIISAVIISVAICQFVSMSMMTDSLVFPVIFLTIGLIAALFTRRDIQKQIQNMEI